ncbi:hypothetical protein GGI43DRAFT_116091 [Trichoderma evansii]
MPALPPFPRRLIGELGKAPVASSLLATTTIDSDAATLVARQQETPTFVVIPETYNATHSSLSTGAVVGVVIGSAAGFILLLLILYTILGFGPLSSLFGTKEIVETKSSYVSRSMLSSARPKTKKPRRKVPTMRAADILSIRRERTTKTTKRRAERRGKGPEIVEPMRRKREPSPLTTITSSSSGAPGRAPRDHLPSDYDEENEVVVIEETTPSSKRHSRKAGPSKNTGKGRRSSSRRSGYSEDDDRRYRR